MTDRSDIQARVCALIREHLALPAEFEVGPESGSGDVPGWDSLGSVTLMLAIQDDFGIVLTLEELAEFETVGQIAAMLQRHVQG